MLGYQFIAGLLKEYGLTHVFYCETMMRKMCCEYGEGQYFKTVLCHSENAAGYMADGYARSSGKPGFVMCQNIGAANLAGGLYDACLAGTPVVSLTGKKPPECQYRACYQEAEHRLIFEGITKFHAEITDGTQVLPVFRQAFREAVTGKPGPVHIDITDATGSLTGDAEIAEEITVDSEYGRFPPFRLSCEEDRIREALQMIKKAKKPVVVAGRGALYAGAGEEILNLAQKCDMPVITTPDGKTVIDEDSEYWAGVSGLYGTACANQILKEADLAILIGTRANDQQTCGWTSPDDSIAKIQIDVDPAELGRNYRRTYGLQGDAKTVVARMAEWADRQKRENWRGRVRQAVNRQSAIYSELQNDDSVPIKPERLCLEIGKVLPHDAILLSDTGYSAVWSGSMIRMKATQTYLRAAGSLGWSLPAAIGAKCANPDRPVVCFSGDGGAYYHFMELETAVRNRIAAVFIINNNGGYMQIKEAYEMMYDGEPKEMFKRCFTFPLLDFTEIAQTLGCWAKKVDNAEDIAPAVREALACGKPAVVEVVTDMNGSYPPCAAIGI